MTVAPGEEDRKGITAVDSEKLLRGRPRDLRAAQELRAQPQDHAAAAGEAQGDRHRQGHRLGDRRGAGVRHAAGRGHAGAAERPGFGARHLLAAPFGADRPEHREQVHPAQSRGRGPGHFEVIDSPLNEAAVLGFEYGYSLGRAQCAGAVGGAVRRLRQRRAGHHRPVHLLGREQVAAHERPRDAAAARLRGPGAGAQLGAPRALPAALGRGQLAGRRCRPRRPTTSTRCAGRCAAPSASRWW